MLGSCFSSIVRYVGIMEEKMETSTMGLFRV